MEPQNSGLTEPLDAAEQNKKLGRGMNIGNAFEAPNEGDWGVTVKEEYFRIIKEKGFNSVRLPVNWAAHAPAEAPYAIDKNFFKRIDQVILQAQSYGLMVVLDMHHYGELMSAPAANKSRFLSLWEQISLHYKNYQGSLILEVLNEPNDQLTTTLWNQYLKEAIAVIRKENPYRTLMIGTANWGGAEGLSSLVLPPEDRNIIVTFHYYNPFSFTHQGAEWVFGADLWLGTTWGTSAEKQAVVMDLDRAAYWASASARPLYLGEFGAYNKGELNSRAAWTYFVAREAEKRGISWAYWEFCSGFGAYDASKNAWIPLLLQALIPPAV